MPKLTGAERRRSERKPVTTSLVFEVDLERNQIAGNAFAVDDLRLTHSCPYRQNLADRGVLRRERYAATIDRQLHLGGDRRCHQRQPNDNHHDSPKSHGSSIAATGRESTR